MLRDQKPLNEKKLAAVLEDGLSTRDWCRLLNGKVFFWGPESRLGILRGARAYEDHRQTILIVDTAKLVQHHRARLSLCHMNSGASQPMAFPRGRKTFQPLDAYPLVERRRKYGQKGAVAEVTVQYAVPNVTELVVEAYETGGGQPRRDLWPVG